MIHIVDSLNKSEHAALLEAMFRLRKRVFHDRLGWDVVIRDGREIDAFDDLDPAHVISVDDQGQVVGCMRLLQTTGPHMLADVFSSILDGEPPLRSATLWEATRFCVDTARLGSGRGPNTISHVTSEVMIGAFEYGMAAGITDAVAVIDPVMDRVLKRSGNAPHGYLGSPKPMGKVTALAALMDVSDERIRSIRDFAGIHYDVFAPQPHRIAAE
ncbi:MAG: GNAT family N-acetyltransferase [Rhodobacterales bacterium]|nr:GNAT family N-acetyltransferase [Rhodobacterales bacterium]